MSSKKEKTIDQLHLGARRAIREAVSEALKEHRAAGVPAAIWKGGKVVYLPVLRKK